MNEEIREFYTTQGPMTDPGSCRNWLRQTPKDLAGEVKTLQGLLIHEHIAPAYGEQISDARRMEVHTRRAEERLSRIAELDDRPLAEVRPLARRNVADCRHYSVLLVSMLRERGVPARARCGFGAYFEQGKYIDHWVAEYWNEAQRRWVMVDAQIDDVQKQLFKPQFDLMDVPRDQFLTAGAAWALCRAGKKNAAAFGVMDMTGLWFVAGNVIRDFAALNNMEMLPWDVWGAMAGPDGDLRGAEPLLDQLAELTDDPDAHFAEIRALYESNDQLKVPATVFNAVLQQPQTV
jgi:hypothetical protein